LRCLPIGEGAKAACEAYCVASQCDSIFKTARPLQAQLRIPAARAPKLCIYHSPKEGAGNAGRPVHPQPRVQNVESTRVSSPQVHQNSPAFPHAMVLTVSFVLSPVIGLLSPSLADYGFVVPGWAFKTSANLTPAPGRQDHTTSPSAPASLVCARRDRSRKNPPCDPIARSTLPRPPHPVPTFVTIAKRPSCGTGWRWI
jgi:hypothetical protein